MEHRVQKWHKSYIDNKPENSGQLRWNYFSLSLMLCPWSFLQLQSAYFFAQLAPMHVLICTVFQNFYIIRTVTQWMPSNYFDGTLEPSGNAKTQLRHNSITIVIDADFILCTLADMYTRGANRYCTRGAKTSYNSNFLSACMAHQSSEPTSTAQNTGQRMPFFIFGNLHPMDEFDKNPWL